MLRFEQSCTFFAPPAGNFCLKPIKNVEPYLNQLEKDSEIIVFSVFQGRSGIGFSHPVCVMCPDLEQNSPDNR